MQVGGGRRPPPLPRLLRHDARLHSRRGSVVGVLLRSGGVAGEGGDRQHHERQRRMQRRSRPYLRRGGCPRRTLNPTNMDCLMKKPHADKYIFWVCLAMSIALMIFGAVMPPPGIIDPSILTASGILLGFAALGVAGQNLANGKEVTFRKGDTEVTIDNEEGQA